ncbi:hypothetical protein L917_06682 [Phytophthora nicotianae]|uniref:Uncharacterized protein n=1 Tax=Phytophthora nicotianae TaxID=4792 RepID=W2LFV5_PHYNI|nr:hypothetical protein L917_06682 [Phytophthora nicotianae]
MRGLITSVATSKDKVIGGYLRHFYLILPILNHSWNPSARFHELQPSDYMTIVAVTIPNVGR